MANMVGQLIFDVCVEFNYLTERVTLEDITPESYSGSLYRWKNFRSPLVPLVFKKYTVAGLVKERKQQILSQIGTVQDVSCITAEGELSFKAKIINVDISPCQRAYGLPDGSDTVYTVAYQVEVAG